MFKNTSAIAAGALLLVMSCKEKGPVINPGDNQAKIGDTTYTTDVPKADSKTVLFEEFTGVSCSSCPNAKKKIEALNKLYPGQTFTIAYHVDNSGFTKKIINLSKFDFRTNDATNVHDLLFRTNDAGLPKGGVSRYYYNDHYWLNPADWSIVTENVLKEEPVANIAVTSSYDVAKSEAIVNVKITYLAETSGKQALTVVVTEDGIVDAQKNMFVIDTFYQHDHVLRDVVTAHSGDTFLEDMETKEAGRVYEKTLLVKADAAWKVENCHVVAFVHNIDAGNKEVLQAAGVALIK